MIFPKNNRKRSYFFIVVILLVLSGIWFFNKGFIVRTFDYLDLTPIEEHFTELYFTDYTTVSKSIENKEPFSFSFTIRNLEGVPEVYLYSIYFEYPSLQRTLLYTNSVYLSNKETKIITYPHVISNFSNARKLVVELTQKNQKINIVIPNEK